MKSLSAKNPIVTLLLMLGEETINSPSLHLNLVTSAGNLIEALFKT